MLQKEFPFEIRTIQADNGTKFIYKNCTIFLNKIIFGGITPIDNAKTQIRGKFF